MGEPRKPGDGNVAILDPKVGEIARALLALGGAAHRNVVADHVARERGLFQPTEAMRRELAQAFAVGSQGATDPRAPTLLHLPHGPGSHRWALTDWAYHLLLARRDAGAFEPCR